LHQGVTAAGEARFGAGAGTGTLAFGAAAGGFTLAGSNTASNALGLLFLGSL